MFRAPIPEQTLDELGTLSGLDFDYEIRRLDEMIAEREEMREDFSEGSGISETATVIQPEMFTDEDVRQMFSALSGDG